MLRICLILLVTFVAINSPQVASARRSGSGSSEGTLEAAAKTDEFKSKHERSEAPVVPQGGETFSLGTGDHASQAYLVKPEQVSRGGIVMVHEWWGLNDHIRHEAHRFADLGYVVLAVDLYRNRVATTRDEAAEYMQGADPDHCQQVLAFAVDYLRDHQNVTKVGTIGWCFGGGWSLKAAKAAGAKVDACVVYYGQLFTKATELEGLTAPVLAIIADQDKWITPAMGSEFKAAMTEAGKKATVLVYPADHAFANPTGDRHHEESARKAWEKTKSFFETSFGSRQE